MANALAAAMKAKKKPMGDVENAADARQPGDAAEDSSPAAKKLKAKAVFANFAKSRGK